MALLAASPALFDGIRELEFDGYQRVSPRERQSAPAVIVAIDERALREYGQWPWPRTLLARLVSNIAAQRPAAIGLDALFPEQDRYAPAALAESLTDLPSEFADQLRRLPSSDDRLGQALSGARVAIAVAGIDQTDPRFPGPPQVPPIRFRDLEPLDLRAYAGRLASVDAIDRAAAARGLISVEAADRIVRRVPLLAEVSGVVVPALSLELWRLAIGTPLLEVSGRSGGLVEIAIGDLAVPVQRDGSFWLRYSPHAPDRFISAADVLGSSADAERLKDKLVLIGVTGVGLLDEQATPLGERVPGVELHAQVIEQIFDRTYLVRPQWAPLLEAALLATGALLVLAIIPGRRVVVSSAALVAILAVMALTGWAAFRSKGILIDVALPAAGVLIIFVLQLAATLAEADRQRRALREATARMEGELDAARRIQSGLLPDPAALREGEPGIDLDARLEPARQVGGDFFDFFKLDLHRLLFMVGDVSGKGMPAALFMALCKATLKAHLARGGSELGTSLSRAAAELAPANREDLFVTLFAGIIDTRTGMLEFCNAGHEPPFARRTDGIIERFPIAAGPPLCVLPDFEYVTEYRQLSKGEGLCVLTDGVTEAANAGNELYGSDRAHATLEALQAHATASDTVTALRDDVARFVAQAEASDDLTLLALRWLGPETDTASSAEIV